MTKLDAFKDRINAIELLRIVKATHSYAQMSKYLALPIHVVSRYVNGRVLPSLKRSKEITRLFNEKFLLDAVRSRVRVDESGIFHLSALIRDAVLQRVIAKVMSMEFKLLQVDKVLTVETNGVPMAVHVATELGVDVIVAKKEKEIGIDEFLEEKCIVSPSVSKYFYVPKDSIRPDERVLIVDDIVRTGVTLTGLTGLTEQARAKTVGVFAIVLVQEARKKLKKHLGATCQILSMIEVAA